MSNEVRDGAMDGARYDAGASREVQVVREGSGQTIRIPEGFEIKGARAVIRREGDSLVIEPVRTNDLLSYLRALDPADRDFPDVSDESLLPLDEPDV